MAGLGNGPEDRTFGDAGGFEPHLDRLHGPGVAGAAEDGDHVAMPLLVGF